MRSPGSVTISPVFLKCDLCLKMSLITFSKVTTLLHCNFNFSKCGKNKSLRIQNNSCRHETFCLFWCFWSNFMVNLFVMRTECNNCYSILSVSIEMFICEEILRLTLICIVCSRLDCRTLNVTILMNIL